MCVQYKLTHQVEDSEKIYSQQGGLKVRSGVWGYALNTPLNLVKNKNAKISCEWFYGNRVSIF